MEPNSHHRSSGRARERAEKHAGNDCNYGQATGDMAADGVGEVDQPLGQAPTLHQRPGQHEERYGHEWESITSRI